MKHLLITGAALVALAATPALAGFKRIASEDQLRAELVGKKLHDENGNWFRWNANGSMSGKLKSGDKFSGAWNWQKGFVCRVAKVGNRDLGQDCQVIERDGNKVRFTRKQGKGESGVLTLR